jgi:imidazolonepropionase
MCAIWSLACVKMKLTPEQALNALTINAAHAMGLEQSHGSISLGKKPGLILTKEIPSLAYIPYSFGENCIERVFI